MIKKIFFFILMLTLKSVAQPYVDILSFNRQQLKSHYVSTINGSTNYTTDYFVGLIVPVIIDSNNLFIARFNGEMLQSSVDKYNSNNSNLYATTLGLGWQHAVNKKFSYSVLMLPKFATDFKDKINQYDVQYGGSLLLQYKTGKNFTVKAGVYYNHEPFGNFFSPLFAVDWKINQHWYLYGVFPISNRLEYKINEHFCAGIGSRLFGRSYRLCANQYHDYVWNQEDQIKLFIDYYITKTLVIYTEAGQTIAYSPQQTLNDHSRKYPVTYNKVYTKIKDNIFINAGIAFRIRKDK